MNRLQRRRQAARLRRCDDTTTVPLCDCCGMPLEGEAAHHATQRALAYRENSRTAATRNYTLVDAAMLRAQHPGAPGAAAPPPDTGNLGPGWLAKVCAKFDSRLGPGGKECFWVHVDTADSGRFRGKIINELNFRGDHGLDEGDEIVFERNHVLDVFAPPRLVCEPAAGSA